MAAGEAGGIGGSPGGFAPRVAKAGGVPECVMTRLLSRTIHSVTAPDSLTYSSVAILLPILVVAASYVPARRALAQITS